ncbi:uncharacterized protein LOC132734303 isoform X2 [Ruditapes philippinarum]|uniref:uncharacterized protein LOC132734303 isoform X1 n=1 Tax=Ruditapes philippinarum TaxID=129788 RepID=UPI00295AA9F9|nr:uncharacterized protein LOC132734303 isoform X1 [Ruditapes philippinarum]XP_060576999.1 uncharacterized protein LOC132734303 isoform X2 [Ruditapes philippinarum]
MKTLCFTVTSVTSAQVQCDFAEVVGNIPELGSWDPAKGVKARGPSDREYTTTVYVPDHIHEIEFKWVFCHRGTFSWEIGLNKIVFDLPQTPGAICHIVNSVNGPAQTYHETEFPEKNWVNEGKKDSCHAKCLRHILTPQKWTRGQKLLGIGIGLLVPIAIAIKTKH